MADRHKEQIVSLAGRLHQLGFELLGTAGTARWLEDADIPVVRVKKLVEGHPNLIDHLIDGNVSLILNTPSGKGARTDEGKIRAAAVAHGVPCVTTIPGCLAVTQALEASAQSPVPNVRALQDWMQSVT